MNIGYLYFYRFLTTAAEEKCGKRNPTFLVQWSMGDDVKRNAIKLRF